MARTDPTTSSWVSRRVSTRRCVSAIGSEGWKKDCYSSVDRLRTMAMAMSRVVIRRKCARVKKATKGDVERNCRS